MKNKVVNIVSISTRHFKGILLFLCCAFAAPLRASVVINEFVYDGVGADTGKEWIELYNNGASTVSLSDWTVEIDSNKFPGTVKATLCGSIAPNGFYLIKETSDTVVDLLSGTLGMGNAGSKADGIQLLDETGQLIDRVVYGGADTDNLCSSSCSTAPAATNGASLARVPDGSAKFIVLASTAVTPVSGGGRCPVEKKPSSSCPEGSGMIRGWITEVAPAVSSDDFIELFLIEPANLCGAKLYEADRLIKTFPSVTPKSGPFGAYVLIHASKFSGIFPDETDSTGDRDANRIVDLYSDESSPGLTSTPNNNLTLKNSDGTTADFLSWSGPSEDSYSTAREDCYRVAVASGLWSPLCTAGDWNCHVTGSIAWFNRSNESMARRMGSTGQPKCSKPSNLGDWSVGLLSPGKGYEAQLSPNGGPLEIFQSPFSPFGDGPYSEALIAYKSGAGGVASMRVYDLSGRVIKTLLENTVSRGDDSQIISWNGKDESGQAVSPGIYVIYLETRTLEGALEKSTRTVVVGRKL